MNSSALLACLPLFVLLLWAAIIDLRTRQIPNWLTLSLAVAGIAQSILFGWSVGPGQSLLGLLVGFALPLALFVLGALGAGDVKLLAAVGAWLGPWRILGIFVAAAILGLLIVLVQSGLQGRLRVLFRNSVILTLNLLHIQQLGTRHVTHTGLSCRSVDKPLPYAVPIFLGSALVSLLAWLGR